MMLKRAVWAMGMSTALVGGLLIGAVPAAQAEPTVEAQVRSTAKISGKPADLLASIPAVAPLAVGYKSGMFLPTNSLTKRNKRGCTLRNELLIKMAVKKPKVVGRQCALQGGEWLVDFGTKRIKKANQVRLGKLLPDKYVYAQGAFAWTPAQKRAYATVVTPPKRSTRSAAFETETWLNSFQPLSGPSFVWLTQMTKTVDMISAIGGTAAIPEAVLQSGPTPPPATGPLAELEALQKRNPEFFRNWTLATLINAKSWGISFAPMLKGNFEVTIEKCSADDSKVNPCNQELTFTSEASKYNITVVPNLSGETAAPTSNAAPSGYGTPTGPVIDRHLFGLHAPADWVSDVETGFEGPTEPRTIPNVPVGYVRLWDTETTWRDLEPEPGVFDLRKLSRQIQTAQILDAKVMMVLGGTPVWAGNGAVTSMPKVEDWRNYVRRIACEFGPSIHAYEIWNEANLQTFFTGTPAEMAELTAAAFQEIRGCNPNALVVAASTTTRATGSFATFFPAYLEELKKRNWPADAYSVHSYPIASGNSEARIQGVAQFRTYLALAGAPFTTVFDTEINYGLAGLTEPNRREIGGADAMTLLSRTYIDSARYGFGSTFWYVWTANGDGKFGIQFTPDTGREQAAWRTTYDWLVGSQFQRCFTTAIAVTVCQFNKGADNFSLVWRGDVGSGNSFTSAGYFTGLGSQVCDLFGSCNVMTKDTEVAVGPMPQRINGTPLGAGVSAPSTPGQVSSAQIGAVEVTNITLDYGVSNKADATAIWIPPKTEYASSISKYLYYWRYCEKNIKCRTFGRGSVAGSITSVTTDLADGPGTYTITVIPVVTAAGGDVRGGDGSRSVELLATRAVPPSFLTYTQRDETIVVSWEAPPVRAGLIKEYDVQTSVNGGPWKPTKATVGPTAKKVVVPWSEIGASLGNTIQVRARTVMKSGLTSIFVATPRWQIVRVLPPPVVAFELCSGVAYLMALGRDSSGAAGGYLIRSSSDGGATWELINPEGSKPGTAWPFEVINRFSLSSGCGSTLVEIRSVSLTSSVLPSEWVPVKLR